MEKKWYSCKLKYRKTDENGVQKLVTESYLVDGVSFSDAEARINEEMKAYISVDFKVVNIQATNYSEVVGGAETGLWFKSKISLIAFDEESGKEKKQNIYILVEAEDAKQAYDRTVEAMQGSMGEYNIPSVSETTIMDVFPYVAKDI